MTQMLAQREHDYFAETVICANCYIVANFFSDMIWFFRVIHRPAFPGRSLSRITFQTISGEILSIKKPLAWLRATLPNLIVCLPKLTAT